VPPSTHHDCLTGLPNRRLFDDRLRQALYLAERRDSTLAVMLLGLALAGPDDARLVELAGRLGSCVRRADTLARYGAAELAFVLNEVAGEAGCRLVAARVLEGVAALAADLAPAIGIALHSGGPVDADALLRNAEAALYRARQAREPVCFYR
jgi:GGDEF domain-containing protein